MKHIIGLDPSYKGFGIAVLDIENCKFKTSKLVVDYTTSDFNTVTMASYKMVKKFMEEIHGTYGVDLPGTHVLMESPPPTAQSSSRLYALDTYLANTLLDNRAKVWYCAPNYIGHLHKNLKWKKSESVFLAKNLIRVLSENGYDVSEVKLESNQAEAFLILIANIQKSEYKIACINTEEFIRYKDCKRYQYEIERR